MKRLVVHDDSSAVLPKGDRASRTAARSEIPGRSGYSPSRVGSPRDGGGLVKSAHSLWLLQGLALRVLYWRNLEMLDGGAPRYYPSLGRRDMYFRASCESTRKMESQEIENLIVDGFGEAARGKPNAVMLSKRYSERLMALCVEQCFDGDGGRTCKDLGPLVKLNSEKALTDAIKVGFPASSSGDGGKAE